MVVITLSNCPEGLRGDLTKWLLEIDVGVFVGRLNARVRDQVWERVCKALKEGRATMAYSAANEQGLKFRVANSAWTPVDFDGLTLIQRPTQGSHSGDAGKYALRPGFSHAAQRMRARQMAGKDSRHAVSLEKRREYVVVDVETTGLAPDSDRMIEVSALRVRDGVVVDTYSALVCQECGVPPKIEALTGITGALLREVGNEEGDVLDALLSFIGKDLLVAHNAGFDVGFINAACRRAARMELTNRVEDTLALAKRRVPDAESYRLRELAKELGLYDDLGVAVSGEGKKYNDAEGRKVDGQKSTNDASSGRRRNRNEAFHKSLTDCYLTKTLYEKLSKMS